jgi:beta-mannosidase
VIRDLTATSVPTSSDLTEWGLSVEVYLDAAQSGTGTVSISLPQLKIQTSQSVSFNLGENLVTFSIPVSNPELWWPNGYGAPNLYQLSAQFTSSGEMDSKSIYIGFRSVEIVKEPIEDSPGLSFYFQINNIPIFLKGANWIPADSFESRVDAYVLSNLLIAAQEANMNVIRNWGGGYFEFLSFLFPSNFHFFFLTYFPIFLSFFFFVQIEGIYQHDEFYRIADQLGLMVWEEFMFACALYYPTEEFVNNVAEEVQFQVRRLKHHPSIIVWSGNNENEAAVAENWYGTDGNPIYTHDYAILYFETLQSNISIVDTSRPFVSSSPSNGYENFTDPVASNPQSEYYGDVHYYNYAADCWNISTYPRPRFASEFGVQSFPSLLTLQEVSIPTDWDWNSTFTAHRQHHQDGNDQVTIFSIFYFFFFDLL